MKRRTFLRRAAGAVAGMALPGFAIGKPGASPNSKLNTAFIKEPAREGWR